VQSIASIHRTYEFVYNQKSGEFPCVVNRPFTRLFIVRFFSVSLGRSQRFRTEYIRLARWLLSSLPLWRWELHR
jgi:hypothetical protein